MSYILAIGIAGLWLVLPWWLPFVYGAVVLWTIASRLRRGAGPGQSMAHLGTLTGERFAPYRGQSYGVDLVRINRVGLRVAGVLPSDPAAYTIFGDPALAPCGGRVVLAEDGAPDMAPPQPNRTHMAGNYVIVECDSFWVVLGHLKNGSVAVHTGQVVEAGHVLGVVGNSGNTAEPTATLKRMPRAKNGMRSSEAKLVSSQPSKKKTSGTRRDKAQ